jgi:hypothetical protein
VGEDEVAIAGERTHVEHAIGIGAWASSMNMYNLS